MQEQAAAWDVFESQFGLQFDLGLLLTGGSADGKGEALTVEECAEQCCATRPHRNHEFGIAMAAMAFCWAKTELANTDGWVAWTQMQHQGGLLRQFGIAGDDDMGCLVGRLQPPLLSKVTEACSAADLESSFALPLLQFGLAPIGEVPRGGRHRHKYR